MPSLGFEPTPGKASAFLEKELFLFTPQIWSYHSVLAALVAEQLASSRSPGDDTLPNFTLSFWWKQVVLALHSIHLSEETSMTGLLVDPRLKRGDYFGAEVACRPRSAAASCQSQSGRYYMCALPRLCCYLLAVQFLHCFAGKAQPSWGQHSWCCKPAQIGLEGHGVLAQ